MLSDTLAAKKDVCLSLTDLRGKRHWKSFYSHQKWFLLYFAPESMGILLKISIVLMDRCSWVGTSFHSDEYYVSLHNYATVVRVVAYYRVLMFSQALSLTCIITATNGLVTSKPGFAILL